MGAISRPVNVLAVVYLLFICGLAVMPNIFPITSATLNYAPIAWGVIAICALTLWQAPPAPCSRVTAPSADQAALCVVKFNGRLESSKPKQCKFKAALAVKKVH